MSSPSRFRRRLQTEGQLYRALAADATDRITTLNTRGSKGNAASPIAILTLWSAQGAEIEQDQRRTDSFWWKANAESPLAPASDQDEFRAQLRHRLQLQLQLRLRPKNLYNQELQRLTLKRRLLRFQSQHH